MNGPDADGLVRSRRTEATGAALAAAFVTPNLVAIPSHTGCFEPVISPGEQPHGAEGAPRTEGRPAILQCYQAPPMTALDSAVDGSIPLGTAVYPRGQPAPARARHGRCRRVALLCINPWNHAGVLQPFSYAAFRVQATLAVDPRLEGVEVRVFEGRDWPGSRWVAELCAFDPDVIGGSAYVWSLPTLIPILRQMKRVRPDAWMVLGGPSARIEMLDHAPFRSAIECLDALVVSEDETALADIVERWGRGDDALREVPGIAVVEAGRWRVVPGQRTRPSPDLRPSPFQLGLIPPGVTAHLQTFVGCPMSCTFCAWGALEDGGVHSEAYLVAELEAFQRSGVKSVISVDAGVNLNRRAFNHLVAAERQVGALRDTRYYAEVYPSHVDDALLEFLGGTRPEIGVGLQSYDTRTLRVLERPFHVDRFEATIARLMRVGPTTIEIILGLPGDRPEAFRHTLDRALELKAGVRVYYCLVLPDALMSRAPAAFELQYDPISLELRSCMSWSERDLRREVDRLNRAVEDRGGVLVNQWAEPVEGDGTISAGRSWYFPPRG